MNLADSTKKITLVATTLLTCLLFAEVSVRVFLFGLAGLSYTLMENLIGIEASGLIQRSSDSDIIFELKPDLDDYFKLVKLKTNSMGLREDKEYSFKKARGVFRVAVIGDSYTMPAGVEIQNAYHKLIEKELNSENLGRRFEFINFGVGAYDLRQYAGVIQHKALGYNPDLILIGWCARNDHIISPESIYTTPYQVQPKQSGFFDSYFVRLFRHVMMSFAVRPKPVNASDRYSKRELSYIASTFGRIKQLTDQIPVVIAYLGFDENQGSSDVERIAKTHGFHFVNTIPSFSNKKHIDYAISRLDMHPNARANKIFADVIYRFLKTHNLLDHPVQFRQIFLKTR